MYIIFNLHNKKRRKQIENINTNKKKLRKEQQQNIIHKT